MALASAFIPRAAGSDAALPSLGVTANSGFCPNGAWDGTRWPGGRRPDDLTLWGSYCLQGDDDKGRIELQDFLAPPALNLYLAGYPGLPGRRLILKNVQSGQETELKPLSTPGDEWRFTTLAVPPEWIGQRVQLIAEDTFAGYLGWFSFSLPTLPPSSLTLPVIDTTVPSRGFCPDGVFPGTQWPGGKRPPQLATWGSYCNGGDRDVGWAASQSVRAGNYISVYIAGYATHSGLRLAVENMQLKRQLLLQVPDSPMEWWQLFHFRLPDEWKGQSVRIVAGDQATGLLSWIAFSDPVPEDLPGQLVSALKTLSILLAFGALLLLPPVAACMLAAWRGVKDLLDLTTIAFLALGLTGYAAFWIYFCSRIAGLFFSYAGLLACCGVIGWLGAKSRRSRVAAAKQLAGPGILVMLASAFILSLGLLCGGETTPLSIAGNRFEPPLLASDNEIPQFFANGIYAGHVPKPLIADWLSSDRPPLQAGNTLWTYIGLPGNRDLQYQALAVVLQCSFLAALWSFLAVCNIDRKPLALALATCFFSGFTYLNGFFTWPKLYPAGFLLLVVAYLLTGRYYQVRGRMLYGAMLGSVVSLALLCHGGSMFALPGIALCMLLLRRFPSGRFLLGMIAAAALLYTPWTLYQKLYDPPGDRLLKWHVAGSVVPQPQASFTALLFSNYGKLKSHELIDLKTGNLKTIEGDIPRFLKDAAVLCKNLGPGASSARYAMARLLRRTMFVNWVPGIGLAMLGPLALLLSGFSRRRRAAEFRAAAMMWLLTVLTLVLWSLILYGPVATLPHQGTYLTEILAFSASCLAFWTVSPWLCAAMTAAQILWNAILFIWLTPMAPQIGVGTLTGPVNVFLAAACMISAAWMIALLAFSARRMSAGPAIMTEGPSNLQERRTLQKPMAAKKVSRQTQVAPAVPSGGAWRAPLADRALAILGAAVTLFILVTTLIVIRNCYIPIPLSDQWDEWRLWFASRHYSSFLFDQHNEHRIVLARIFFYIDQFFFHARNTFLFVSIFLIQVITAISLWRTTLSSGRFSRISGVLLGCFMFSCLFSAQQFNNFTWGFQIQFVAVYCTAAGAIFALARGATSKRTDLCLALACFLAVLSTYSMSNGLLVWPLLLGLSFWLGSPVRHRIVLGAGMVVMGAAYLWGYHSPGYHANPVDSFTYHLPQVLTFAAIVLGSPADPPVSLLMRKLGTGSDTVRLVCCGILGLAGVLAALGCLLAARRKRQLLNAAQIALSGVLLFILVTAFLVGLGRVNFPLMDALVSRYATPAMIFWSALAGLAWSLFGPEFLEPRPRPRAWAYAALVLFMMCGIAAEQPQWIAFSKGYASGVADFEAVAVSGVDDPEVMRSAFHTPGALFAIFDYMKEQRLSVFTEDWTHWQGTPLAAHFDVDAASSCQGSFDGVTQIPSAARPGFKAAGWAWDKKDGRAPQTIILADRSGRIVGVARNMFERGDVAASVPATRSSEVGWRGYMTPTGADPVTAYLLESNGKSVCAVGSLPTAPPVHEATLDELSAPVEAPVKIEGAWTRDGYPGESGKPPFDGPVYASWSGSDANTGTITLGPINVANQTAIGIPIISGPKNEGLILEAVNAKTGELIAALSPPPVHLQWWVWRIDLPTSPDLSVKIVAQDTGRAWGEWEAVGMPHSLKNSVLSPLAMLNGSAQEVPLPAIGAALESGPPAIEGFWTKDGYNAEAGRPPLDGASYGSWSGSDAHTGTIRLGPFSIRGQQSIAIPLVTGPSNTGTEVRVVDVASGEILALLSPAPRRMKWWVWRVGLPPGRPGMKIVVQAQDNGAGWGQWQAIGTPHSVK